MLVAMQTNEVPAKDFAWLVKQVEKNVQTNSSGDWLNKHIP